MNKFRAEFCRYFVAIILASLTVCSFTVCPESLAQNFIATKGPSGGVYLIDLKASTMTDLGGAFVEGPLLVEANGVPFIFIRGVTALWYRTNNSDGWKGIGPRCTGLKTVKVINGAPYVDAYCPDFTTVSEGSITGQWVNLQNPNTEVTLPTNFPLFENQYAVVIDRSQSTNLLDFVNKSVTKLGGQITNNPQLVMMGGELLIFGTGSDNSVWFRGLSRPWQTLGGQNYSITSINATADGSDVVLVATAPTAQQIYYRTLTTDWVLGSPLDAAKLASKSSTPLSDLQAPPTAIDQYLTSFISAWGDDITHLQNAKTEGDFMKILPSLHVSTLELKIIQAFNATSIAELMKKLVVAFPRSANSDGAAAAMKSAFTALQGRRDEALPIFASALRTFPADELGDQRTVLVDLFSRIPGISPQLRSFTRNALKDQKAGTAPGALSSLGLTYYVVILANSYLQTKPALADADAAFADAFKFNLSDDQRKKLTDALASYKAYAAQYFNCSTTGCIDKPQDGESCSAQSPCLLGLQCFQGACHQFGAPGDACGKGHPFCNPLLTCSSVGLCAEPSKLGESCRQKACQQGLSCLKQIGLCVATAKVGEACAGTSRPCVDQVSLACVKGFCKKKGALSDVCAADNPCLDAFYCSATTNGTCLSKRTLGQACSPQDVCLSGLSCRSTLGVVVSPSSSICVTTAKLGEACGPTTFCDNAAGLFCGSKNVCRVPGQTSDYCATDSECASGLYCVGGTCNPPGGYGAQCTSNKNCKTDFVCDTHSPSPTNGQCVQKGGSGSSCPCLSGFDCVDSICAARGGVNSFCGSAHYPRCSDNLICTGGGVSTPGTCKALGGVGDFCSSNGSGWPPCATGLTCSSTNHCAAGLGEGGDCWGTRSSLPCAEGFICVVKSGKGSCTSTCSSINGTLCGTSNNYACRYTPGIHLGDKPMSCIRKLPYGSGCVSDNDPYSAPCMTDLFCSPSLTSCQFRSLKGESCSMDGVSMPCIAGTTCRVVSGVARCY